MLSKKQQSAVAISLLACALIGAGAVAYNWGHQAHKNRTQFIRKHRTNRITIQVDSIQTGTFGTSVGVGVGGVQADTLWVIRGARKDTSVAFMAWPYMAHRFAFDDTSDVTGTDDSVKVKAKLYAGSRSERFADQKLPPPFGGTYKKNYWALVDSVTITGATPVWKVWTASAIPNAPWYYLVLEGDATLNKKAVPGSIGTIVADHWDELPLK